MTDDKPPKEPSDKFQEMADAMRADPQYPVVLRLLKKQRMTDEDLPNFLRAIEESLAREKTDPEFAEKVRLSGIDEEYRE